jgi:hypothetical protein
VVGHRRLLSLILDGKREHKFVDPRWLDVHVHQDPPLLGTLPTALEDRFDVFIPMITSQGKADPTEDHLGVSGRRVIVPEKAGFQWDSQPALAQHYEVAKCRNNVGVEMNQRTSQIIHDAR